jgi:hypothetical protein
MALALWNKHLLALLLVALIALAVISFLVVGTAEKIQLGRSSLFSLTDGLPKRTSSLFSRRKKHLLMHS